MNNLIYIVLPPYLIPLIVIIFVFGFLGLFVFKRTVRVPANKSLVVYGKVGQNEDGSPKRAIIIPSGGSVFILPFIQAYEFLNHDRIPVYVTSYRTPTLDHRYATIELDCDVRVSRDESIIYNAAERLLGLKSEEIARLSESFILGRLNQAISQSIGEDIDFKRDQFFEKIVSDLESDVIIVGLEFISIMMKKVDISKPED